MAMEMRSVGGAYRENDMLSVEHPYYRTISDAVSERVHELGVERGMAKASVRTVLMGVALQPSESFALSEAYPELNIVAAGQARPGHAYWVAYRRAANEWLMEQADKMSSSVAHLGGSLASYLFAGLGSSATLLCDLTEPIAVHEKYATTMEAHAMFENYVGLSKVTGKRLDHRVYDSYLRKEGVKFHSKLNSMPECEVLLVDLTIASYNPMQVASMMKQSGAGVCLGFFVYHPSMLFSREGEVGNTGVYFTRMGDHVYLRYPEGSAGVTDFGAHTWDSWLLGHTFKLGTGVGAQWYQLELLRNRGHLMFFRMTALSCEPEQKSICHALDVGDADSYIVSSWSLKHFGANPSKRSSWAYGSHVVKKRIVDRLYQFAMQLPKDQFTRYALRKQVSVINDRITIEGTMVTVVKPLPVEVVDALVVAVYSRAFVDRYESTQLTVEAMGAIRAVNAFAGAGAFAKMGYIAMMCMQTAYDYTFGTVDQVMRTTSDEIRRRLSTGLMPMEVAIDTMPPYILVSEAALGAGLSPDVGAAVAAENSRLAALGSSGFTARWSRAFASLTRPCPEDVYRRYRVQEVNLMQVARAVGPAVDAALAAVRQEIALDEASVSRSAVDATMVVRQARAELRIDFEPVSDPVEVLNALHSAAFPGVAEQNLEYDVASLSFDPQDRMLAASRMTLSTDFGPGPVSRSYYRSKLRALNVPKRQQTLQELLSSIAARNLNAPQIALPQDEDTLVLDVWSNFLKVACVDDVQHKLMQYQSDPASLSEDSFREWAMQSDSSKLDALRRELSESLLSFADMSVAEYLVMLKADVKPPMSSKPLSQRTEPQVIVYHNKALSGLFSSLFRVLVRRFLSLLKPEYHVNLLKDTRDIEDFLRAIHPFGNTKLKYLENDFSKYDKSQGRFAFLLEAHVFQQLGMNQDMLDKWLGGHVKCSMRAVSMMLRLEVWYQRKSGDATTAYGNVLINLLSTAYAYKMSKVKWALYMGDDSLVCCEDVLGAGSAVDALAEIFNLGAKMFITESPYFASNFVFFDDASEDVAMVADPVKRVERWSMSLSADDPQWEERYISACDALRNYLSVHKLMGMSKALLERYGIPTDASAGAGAAIATLLSSRAKFRSIWEEFPEVSNY